MDTRIWRVLFIISVVLFLWSLLKTSFAILSSSREVFQCSPEESGTRATLGKTNIVGDDHRLSMVSVLKEIEPGLLFHRNSSFSTKPLAVAKDISYGRYYALRDSQGWSMAYRRMHFDFVELSFRTQVKIEDLAAYLCLGIQSQDKHCLHSSVFQNLHKMQRYNQIHGIRDIIWRKDGFCYTMREALSGFKGAKNFTFPCWVLPKDEELLRREMNRTDSLWIVKPSGQGEGHGIFIANRMNDITKHQHFFDTLVVQPFLIDPYLVEGRKFDFRTYVLVTSIIPLRAYIYKEGLVRFASSKYDHNASKGGSERQYLTNTSIGKKYTHLGNLTWTFQKLKDYFSSVGVDGKLVFEGINEAIVKVLLAAEYRFQRNFMVNLRGYDCHSCFQLLGVDVILDSSLHAYVIEVNGLPSMQLSHDLGVLPDPSSEYTITKFGLMHDLLQILFKPTSVVQDLARYLYDLRVGMTPGPLCSSGEHTLCVDYKDMQKLLDSRREFVNRGDYQRIYPSPNGDIYSSLIKRMHTLIVKKFSEAGMRPPRTLWQLHYLYTALENLYYTEST